MKISLKRNNRNKLIFKVDNVPIDNFKDLKEHFSYKRRVCKNKLYLNIYKKIIKYMAYRLIKKSSLYSI